eukprot:GEMP01000060.1.p1 GENE.GEMP01000060.1~~GEMP01000060.1.p1  ORF type:complete len:3670 (+),score=1304.13 GEMP01000060.1:198-11207(+)
MEYHDLQDQLRIQTEQFEVARHLVESLNAEKNNYETRLQEMARGMQEREMEISRLQGVVQNLQSQVDSITAKGKAADRIQELLNKESEARRTVDEELMKVREEKNLLREQVRDILDSQSTDKKQFEDDRGRVKEIYGRLHEVEGQNEDLQNQNFALKVELANLRSGEGRTDAEFEAMQKEIETLNYQLEVAEREAETENRALKLTLEEQTLQIQVQQRFEIDYDQQVSNLLEEKEELLIEKEKELSALQVRSKARELEMESKRAILNKKRTGEDGEVFDDVDVSQLTIMLYDKEMENTRLAEEVERLEQRMGERLAQPTKQVSGMISAEQEALLASLKVEQAMKDEQIRDLREKNDQFLRGFGYDASDWDRKVNELLREKHQKDLDVTNAKKELSEYLHEASNIVYENMHLRQLAQIPADQLLDLKDMKLMERVAATKAVAMQKLLEKEVNELEDERSQLKMKLRSMTKLAAEKAVLFHGMEPEQMLHLEQIAESLKKGKLVLPMTDKTEELLRENKKLKRQVEQNDANAAQLIGQHVEQKVKEVVASASAHGALNERCQLFEKENLELKGQLERHALPPQPYPWGGTPHSRQQNVPTPQSSPTAYQTQASDAYNLGATQISTRAPTVLPFMHGIPPAAYSSILNRAVQVPHDLVAKPSVETICSLYVQSMEGWEELKRSKEVQQNLENEVEVYRVKFEKLLAGQEVLYNDFTKQQTRWKADKFSTDNELRGAKEASVHLHEQLRQQGEQLEHLIKIKPTTPLEEVTNQLFAAMQRVAIVEQNESRLIRKYKALEADSVTVRNAFDSMHKDFADSEAFLKQRISSLTLWKQRAENALRISTQKISNMVPVSDYEKVSKKLVVYVQRELDLLRRQSELLVSTAAQEDRLAHYGDLEEKVAGMDNFIAEMDHEVQLLHTRLEMVDGAIRAENQLYRKMVAQFRRYVGGVGEWHPHVPPTKVEHALEAKLKEFDPQKNGFISLNNLNAFLRNVQCVLDEGQLSLIATSLHTEQGSTREVPIGAFITRLRLFGLRTLGEEDHFWAAIERTLYAQNLEPHKLLQLLTVSPSGQITLDDLLLLFTRLGLPVEDKVRQKVLHFLWPKEDNKAPYQELVDRFTSRVTESRRLFEEVIVEPASEAGKNTHIAQSTAPLVSEWREATLNRRVALLDMELKDKTRVHSEAKKQIAELERLTLRLETDLHEQRRLASEADIKLVDMVPSSTVEPKLKRVEELSFELQQRRVELAQSKDLLTVCARQTENLEQLIRRRQEENKHLADTVKLLQSKDEMELHVGRLQHRLLFSQWERSNATTQYTSVVGELRRVRNQVFEVEKAYEDATATFKEENDILKKQIAELVQETHTLRQAASSNFSIEKAQELAGQVEEIAKRKTGLEANLHQLREEKALLLSQLDEAKLESRQAAELMEEMRRSVENNDGENPRKRLMNMAEKVAEARLGELRQKRRADIALEQLGHNQTRLGENEKQIEAYQHKLIEADLKLQNQEELWRDKVRDAQELGSIGGSGLQAAARLGMGGAQGGAGNVTELVGQLNTKTARVAALEAELVQEQAEHNAILERNEKRMTELQTKVKALMASDGTSNMRQMLFAEHQKELREMSAAAQESVALLQDVIAQKDAQLVRCESEIEELLVKLQHLQEGYMLETQQLKAEKGTLLAQTQRPHTPRTPTDVKMRTWENMLEQKDGELAETSDEVRRQKEVAMELRKELLAVQTALDEQMKLKDQTRAGRISQSLQRQLQAKERELSKLTKALEQMKVEIVADEHVTASAKQRETQYRGMADDLERRMRQLRISVQEEKDKNDRLNLLYEQYKKEAEEYKHKDATHHATRKEREDEVALLLQKLEKNVEMKDAQIKRLVQRSNELEDEVTTYRRQKEDGDKDHAKASYLTLENEKMNEMMKSSEKTLNAKVESLKSKLRSKGEMVSQLEDENVRLRESVVHPQRCHVCGAEQAVDSGMKPLSADTDREREIRALRVQLETQTDELQDLHQDYRTLRDSRGGTETHTAELRAQCERLQARNEDMRHAHDALQHRYAALEKHASSLREGEPASPSGGSASALRERVERMATRCERMQEQYDKAMDENEALRRQQQQPSGGAGQAATGDAALQAETQKRRLDLYERRIETLESENETLRNLARAGEDSGALKDKIVFLQQERVELQRRVAQLSEDAAAAARAATRDVGVDRDVSANALKRKDKNIMALEIETSRSRDSVDGGLAAVLQRKDQNIASLEAEIRELQAQVSRLRAGGVSGNRFEAELQRKDDNIAALQAENRKLLTNTSQHHPGRDPCPTCTRLRQQLAEVEEIETQLRRQLAVESPSRDLTTSTPAAADCGNCRVYKARIENLKLDLEHAEKDKDRLVDQLHGAVEDKRRTRIEEVELARLAGVHEGDDGGARRRLLDLLTRVEMLETENERLTKMKAAEAAPAERQAKMVEKIATLQDENERLVQSNERLTTRNEFLEKEHSTLLQKVTDQAMLTTKVNDLIVRNERLEAQKNDVEDFEVLLATCKRRLTSDGVTLMQMLKALDTDRSGTVPMATLKRAINILPLEFSGNQLARQFDVSVTNFHSASGDTVHYVNWLESLMQEDPFGLVDVSGVFRGFSLRSAMRVVDVDNDGVVSRKDLSTAFRCFFEFLTGNRVDALIHRSCPQDTVALMDLVWTFDTAFCTSKGHAYAVRNFKKDTLSLCQEGKLANPFTIIKQHLEHKPGRLTANLRKLCHKYDWRKTGYITLDAYIQILRDEARVPVDKISDERLAVFFEEHDKDGDRALSLRDFELLITPANRDKELRALFARLDTAIAQAHMTVEGAVSSFDINHDGELSRGEFERMLKRLEVTMTADEVDAMIDEFDMDGSGTVSLSEFAWRMNAAKLQDVISAIKAHVEKEAISLYDVFLQADENHDGVLTLAEFHSIFQSLRVPMGKAKMQMIFNLFDSDRSGVVSYREFLQRFDYRATERTPSQKEKLTLTGAQWQQGAMSAIKRKLLQVKTPAREFLAHYDVNEAGSLTMPNFRRALWALGFEINQTESDKVFDLFDEERRRGPAARGRPGAVHKVRRVDIDTVLAKLRTVESKDDKRAEDWSSARRVLEQVQKELKARRISVIKLLSDLDPLNIRKVLLHSFVESLCRLVPSLPLTELKKIEHIVRVDAHGMALVDDIARCILEQSAPCGDLSSSTSPRKPLIGGGLPALEGPPPAGPCIGGTAASSTAAPRTIAPPPPEFRQRKQMDTLTKAVRSGEDTIKQLQARVKELEADVERKDKTIENFKEKCGSTEEELKERGKLRQRLVDTEQLRQEMFDLQAELAECKRRLKIETVVLSDQEKRRIELITRENRALEAKVKNLQFDLKRARSARLGDDWSAKEEEYMRLTLNNERLEEDVAEKDTELKQLRQQLLKEEHRTMELLFDKSQVDIKISRLENRILELETVKEIPISTQELQKKSRKERNLEAVIEGMERVIATLRKDNEKLRKEVDVMQSDKRSTHEARLLKKRVETLQVEINERENTAQEAAACMRDTQRALELVQSERESMKREKAGLASEVRLLREKLANSGAEEELARLKLARQQDLLALDEADKVLQEVEKTESRLAEVVKENEKLRADVAALQDDTFWEELENLRMKNDVSTELFAEVRGILMQHKNTLPAHLMSAIDSMLLA